MSKEIFDSLPPWGQIVLTIIGIVFGAYVMWKGLSDRNKHGDAAKERNVNSGEVPLWTMMGPAHEAIQTVHDIAEEARKQTTVLVDMAKGIASFNRGQEHTHQLLENMMRNQELRPDAVSVHQQSPPRRRIKKRRKQK